MTITVYLFGGTNFRIPWDCALADKIEGIGGSGAAGTSSGAGSGGAGAGAYGWVANVALTAGAIVDINVPRGGQTYGEAGQDARFMNVLLVKGGQANNGYTGGQGGQASQC